MLLNKDRSVRKMRPLQVEQLESKALLTGGHLDDTDSIDSDANPVEVAAAQADQQQASEIETQSQPILTQTEALGNLTAIGLDPSEVWFEQPDISEITFREPNKNDASGLAIRRLWLPSDLSTLATTVDLKHAGINPDGTPHEEAYVRNLNNFRRGLDGDVLLALLTNDADRMAQAKADFFNEDFGEWWGYGGLSLRHLYPAVLALDWIEWDNEAEFEAAFTVVKENMDAVPVGPWASDSDGHVFHSDKIDRDKHAAKTMLVAVAYGRPGASGTWAAEMLGNLGADPTDVGAENAMLSPYYVANQLTLLSQGGATASAGQQHGKPAQSGYETGFTGGSLPLLGAWDTATGSNLLRGNLLHKSLATGFALEYDPLVEKKIIAVNRSYAAFEVAAKIHNDGLATWLLENATKASDWQDDVSSLPQFQTLRALAGQQVPAATPPTYPLVGWSSDHWRHNDGNVHVNISAPKIGHQRYTPESRALGYRHGAVGLVEAHAYRGSISTIRNGINLGAQVQLFWSPQRVKFPNIVASDPLYLVGTPNPTLVDGNYEWVEDYTHRYNSALAGAGGVDLAKVKWKFDTATNVLEIEDEFEADLSKEASWQFPVSHNPVIIGNNQLEISDGSTGVRITLTALDGETTFTPTITPDTGDSSLDIHKIGRVHSLVKFTPTTRLARHHVKVTITPIGASPNPAASSDNSAGNSVGDNVLIDVLANDTGGASVDPTTVQVVGVAGGQQLVVPNEGTWSVDSSSGAIAFSPNPGFVGNPTPISYTVRSVEGGTSNPATVTVLYVPIAGEDSSAANEPGQTVTLDVLDNDDLGEDVVSSTLQIVGTQNPGDSLVVEGGEWSINNGQLVFDPSIGFPGSPDDIQYVVADAQGDSSLPTVVSVNYQVLNFEEVSDEPVVYDGGGFGQNSPWVPTSFVLDFESPWWHPTNLDKDNGEQGSDSLDPHSVAEEPVAEEPVAEEPVAEEPVAEEPVAEEPVAEEPVAEEPVAEEPVAEEPVAEEPVAEEPVAEEPVAEEPVAEEPVAEEPVAEEPVAEEPVAEEPVAEEPVAEEPVAEEPVAEEPVAEEPVAEEPVAEEPVAEEPVAEEPVAEEPVAEEPVAEEPVAEEPVAEEPVAEEPVAEEPVAEEPVAEEPVAEEPVAEEPVAEEPVAEDTGHEPVAEEPVVIPDGPREESSEEEDSGNDLSEEPDSPPVNDKNEVESPWAKFLGIFTVTSDSSEASSSGDSNRLPTTESSVAEQASNGISDSLGGEKLPDQPTVIPFLGGDNFPIFSTHNDSVTAPPLDSESTETEQNPSQSTDAVAEAYAELPAPERNSGTDFDQTEIAEEPSTVDSLFEAEEVVQGLVTSFFLI